MNQLLAIVSASACLLAVPAGSALAASSHSHQTSSSGTASSTQVAKNDQKGGQEAVDGNRDHLFQNIVDHCKPHNGNGFGHGGFDDSDNDNSPGDHDGDHDDNHCHHKPVSP